VLIFGDKYIASPNFVKIDSIEDIKNTKPNDILLLNHFNKPYTLAKYCKQNNLEYAVYVNSIKDSIYANAFNASYILANFNLAKELQLIANEYLWDSKILAIIKSENEIEMIAKEFIDGVIFLN